MILKKLSSLCLCHEDLNVMIMIVTMIMIMIMTMIMTMIMMNRKKECLSQKRLKSPNFDPGASCLSNWKSRNLNRVSEANNVSVQLFLGISAYHEHLYLKYQQFRNLS